MSIISQIQALVPALLISYCFPLPIVVSLWVSFGQWLTAKRRSAAMVYIFSVCTYAVARTTTLTLSQAAIVGGIIAPALYGLLFIGLGIARTLRTPYGYSPYGYDWQHRSMPSSNQLKRWTEALLGACIGCIAGITIGVLLGYLLILIVYSLVFLLTHSFPVQENLRLIDLTVYGSGTLGFTLGLLAGLGLMNWQRLSERSLICLVIYFSFIATVIKRTLRPK